MEVMILSQKQKKQQQTTKKLKVVGRQTYINTATGELEDMEVSLMEDRDFNFHKVWMKNLIATLDIVSNQKTKICFWIIDNLNKENELPYTQRMIAEKTGTSLPTVNSTIKILQDADFLRKPAGKTVYMVNPNIIFKGTRNGRLAMATIYESGEYQPLSDEEKLKNLIESIKELEKLKSELENKTTQEQNSTVKDNNDQDNEQVENVG